MAKGRSRKKKKSPVNWIEIAVQFLTGANHWDYHTDNRQAMEIAERGESPSLLKE